MTKEERSRNLRYKRGALASMGFEAMTSELSEISEACSDVAYFFTGGDKNLVDALDGNEEEAFEFRLAFSDLNAKCDQLNDILYDDDFQQSYDDCTVALVGNRYDVVGFDSYEEDYYSLTRYEMELSQTEAGKRLMRLTKPEMLSTIGQAVGTLMAFLDLRERYDYLKATLDILRDENHSILQSIKKIEAAYEEAAEIQNDKHFDALISTLPDEMWVE